MNKFLEGVMAWKTYVCFMFSGCICVYCVITLCMGSTTLSIWSVFQMLLISALGTLIQGIAFNEEWFIKKAKYSTRIIIFVIPFLLLLTGCALLFKWFPTDEMVNWLMFVGIFLLIFIVMTLSFELFFRLTGKKYDGLLGQYKKNNNIEE